MKIMTDAEWKREMKKCHKALSRYKAILRTIEDEYERRFGVHPSEIDDDNWIDTFHAYPDSPLDFKRLMSSPSI